MEEYNVFKSIGIRITRPVIHIILVKVDYGRINRLKFINSRKSKHGRK
jgi:hypothetical protein